MHRPDSSDYVVHFTKAGAVKDHDDIVGLGPRERLVSILELKVVRGTPMPWTGARCASFTECPWPSLLAHAERYSPFGIGFHKDFLWTRGGGPAIYLRPELYSAQMEHVRNLTTVPSQPGKFQWPPSTKGFAYELWPFITPIARTPFELVDGQQVPYAVDFSHEREWRVPGGLEFDYGDVAFLVVDSFEDVDHLPDAAVQIIGTDNIVSMSNCRRIEGLWPG